MTAVWIVVGALIAIPAANVWNAVECFFVVHYAKHCQYVNLSYLIRYSHFVKTDVCPALARPYHNYPDSAHLG